MNDISSKIWFYVKSENKPTGPVSIEELQQLAASGEIALETFVTRKGDSEWRTFEIASLPPDPQTLGVSRLPPLPTVSDERKWWYADKTMQQVGPVTLDELVELRRTGTISHLTKVFKRGRDEWEPFSVAVAFEESITTWPAPAPATLPIHQPQTSIYSNTKKPRPRPGCLSIILITITLLVLLTIFLPVLIAIFTGFYAGFMEEMKSLPQDIAPLLRRWNP
ncbi:MAG: DUF4339 domain-containing protein [bacterium]